MFDHLTDIPVFCKGCEEPLTRSDDSTYHIGCCDHESVDPMPDWDDPAKERKDAAICNGCGAALYRAWDGESGYWEVGA